MPSILPVDAVSISILSSGLTYNTAALVNSYILEYLVVGDVVAFYNPEGAGGLHAEPP